ncbi:hypothetical protein RA280_37215 [Cupriavidus sp. CV2]|uniref:hypothetical protein n=1 Tax=Cupriavidus ulmosensis TaxID=3065913 RepID=UPI00296ADAFC|nr:hypothetical protein [Cupriavidus sp. CV2]MDW3687282.1 hypothetical protein [Cupriavidus sp. CV2]
MLSPHEIAALMHVDSTQDCLELNPTDLDVLVDRKFVRLELLPEGRVRLSLTSRGREVLNAISKSR